MQEQARLLSDFRDQILARPRGSSLNVDGRHSVRIGAALSMAGQCRLDHTAVRGAYQGHFVLALCNALLARFFALRQ